MDTRYRQMRERRVDEAQWAGEGLPPGDPLRVYRPAIGWPIVELNWLAVGLIALVIFSPWESGAGLLFIVITVMMLIGFGLSILVVRVLRRWFRLPIVISGRTLEWVWLAVGLILLATYPLWLDNLGVLCSLPAALVFTGFGAWRLVRRILRRWFGSPVAIYREGLVYFGRKSDDVFRWDEIEAVWESIYTAGWILGYGRDYRYKLLRRRDGVKIELKGYSSSRVLGEDIKYEVLQRELPRTFEIVDSGGEVAFGEWRVSRDGIRFGDEMLRWDQFDLRYKHGEARSYKRGGEVNARDIPNAFVLYALAERMRARRKEAAIS